MNKNILVVGLVTLLTGCQTSSHLTNMANGGMSAFTCGQIQSAFSAYDADRQSVEMLSNLSKMINVDYATLAGSALQMSDTYYQNVKDATNIALSIKGCSTL